MIYRLQKKLILISSISIIAVFATIFALIAIFSTYQTANSLDMLTDTISEGQGKFPDNFGKNPNSKDNPDRFLNGETKFSTRHFTVIVNNEKTTVLKIFSESIQTVDNETAIQYAEKALNISKERGYINNFRYKVYNTTEGIAITFVDGTTTISMTNRTLISTAIVLSATALLIITVIILLSKKAVKPFAENYNKQKQFITDASHELKTPLTLILTDIDIAKEEPDNSEWLDDIKVEGQRMASLVNQMVTLTRMDELESHIQKSEFNLSEVLLDTVSEFQAVALQNGKKFISNIENDIKIDGDEVSIRRLLAIILDNAVKYCDKDGEIAVSLYEKGKKVYFSEENTFSNIKETDTSKLFDRFYRSDKARTSGSGFGIGLSIAKATIEAHSGEIYAKKVDDNHIGFYFSIKK